MDAESDKREHAIAAGFWTSRCTCPRRVKHITCFERLVSIIPGRLWRLNKRNFIHSHDHLPSLRRALGHACTYLATPGRYYKMVHYSEPASMMRTDDSQCIYPQLLHVEN